VNTRSPLVVGIAALAGLALLAIAVVYWAEPARSLPSFFPGHEAGSAHHHVKHGLASLVVGLVLLVFAWFQTGSKKQPA
jgi:ammonia channel protein AmtB